MYIFAILFLSMKFLYSKELCGCKTPQMLLRYDYCCICPENIGLHFKAKRKELLEHLNMVVKNYFVYLLPNFLWIG